MSESKHRLALAAWLRAAWLRAAWLRAAWLMAAGGGIAALLASPAALADPTWLTSHPDALAKGKQENKPIILDMWAEWCVACKDLARTTFTAEEVVPLLQGFVLAKLDMDAKENEGLWGSYAVSSLPQVFFLRPNGTRLQELTLSQFEEPAAFAARLRKARAALGMADGSAAGQEAEAPSPVPNADHGIQGNSLLEDERLSDAIAAVQGDALLRGAQISARLLSSATAVSPGERFWVAVHLHIREGWHIYWKVPGDSGRPTQVTLRAPGMTFGEVQWPQPYRFEERGDLITYGYVDEVILPIEVRVDEEWTGDDIVPITANASWLVCEKNCVPGQAEVRTQVRIAPQAELTPVASHIESALRKVASEETKGIAIETAVHGEGAPGSARVVRFTLTGVKGNVTLGPSAHGALPLAAWAEPPLEVSQREVRSHTSEGSLIVDVPVAPNEGAGGPVEGRVGLLVAVDHAGAPAYTLARHALALGGGAEAAAALPTLERAPRDFQIPVTPEVSLWEMLLFAFVGGIILNVMPCVLPVLSLKAMGLVKQAGEDKRIIWWHGLAYAAGVLVSFLALAIIVVALKASGELVGWGFQMQNPGFVLGLCAVVFAFSLSMFGVYEVAAPGADLAHQASAKGGLAGSFFNGGFATLLATPCTAPFLGPAMGFAFSQPSSIIVMMFLVVGAGLALPFVLLARFPALIRKIPRGGTWMDTFKHVMGFLLVATAVWLLDVLSQQLSPRALIGAIAFLGIIAVAAWLYGRFADYTASPAQRAGVSLAAVGFLVGGAMLTLSLDRKPAEGAADAALAAPGDIRWKPFTPDLIRDLQTQGQTVFIDFTAAWCVTCKANENAVIDTDPVKEVLRELAVVSVKADFTNHNEDIATWLRRYNRVGVPLYVIIPGERPEEPIVLPELLTSSLLIEALRAAGPSKTASAGQTASLGPLRQ